MVQRFKPSDADKDQRPKAGKKMEYSTQNPDGRNGRYESKKIMKKSASFKICDIGSDLKGLELMKAEKKPRSIDLSDIDGLVSLPHIENHVQPGKPPPAGVLSSVPNYMKPTRSSGAKNDDKQASVANCVKSTTCDKTQATKSLRSPKPDTSGRCLVKMPSLKLARNLTKSSSFKQAGSREKSIQNDDFSLDKHVKKETCSSRLKDIKFPSHVMIEAGGSESCGASSMEVCTYKYCSLNGHRHAKGQPLKGFISGRRQSSKKEKSLKLHHDASRQVPFVGKNEIKEDDGHATVEIGTNNILATRTEAESDEEIYETIWEAYEKEIQEFEYIESQLEEEVYIKIENEEDFDCISENSFKGSVTVSNGVADICTEDELEGCWGEDECMNNNNSQCENSEEITDKCSDTEDLVDKEMVFAEDETTAVCAEENGNAEDRIEDKCEMDQESIELDQNAFACTPENGEPEVGMLGIKIIKGKAKAAGDEDSDSEKDFNLQEPNYLPLEPVPKAEQVDLKHQDIDERRNSEEWMVDYALRKTVTKLAPVKRKKVELLVEAFESVAPYQT